MRVKFCGIVLQLKKIHVDFCVRLAYPNVGTILSCLDEGREVTCGHVKRKEFGVPRVGRHSGEGGRCG